MALPEEEMPGTRPSGVGDSGPILGLAELQPDITGYQIEGPLGSGAMGSVYAAIGPDGSSVAIKVLHDPQPDEMTRRRFEREVAALQKLDHPGVPQVYDSGQLPDGRLFLVMERLNGTTLEDWYDEPGHTRLEALELIADALDALAVAHVRGVVHRDIKPENIFVLETPDQGRKVKLLDFGIALHPAEGEAKRTATGISVGTPCYMSPEQAARPKLVGAHSDVWSIGVVLYEALCGELPFDGETAHGVVVAICAAAHLPLVERSPQTHPDLLALVESCLVKSREDRPINAAELRDAVVGLLARDDVRQTLGGPAATPDLHVMPRASFAESEELTDPERSGQRSAERDQLAVAATISAELASPEPPKSKAPMLLAMLGVLLGITVAVLYLQSDTAPPGPVSNDAPTSSEMPDPPIQQADLEQADLEQEQADLAQADLVEEAQLPEAPTSDVIEDVEDVEPEVETPEPDLVVRPRMRARPRIEDTEQEPEVAVAEMEPDPVEPVVMEPVVMEPVVMQPTMQATMEPVRAATMTQTMRTRPRMRPSMTQMRRTGDRPGFVTF